MDGRGITIRSAKASILSSRMVEIHRSPCLIGLMRARDSIINACLEKAVLIDGKLSCGQGLPFSDADPVVFRSPYQVIPRHCKSSGPSPPLPGSFLGLSRGNINFLLAQADFSS